MMHFSMILPVYNVAPYLEACLASVCHQSFADWECICVDDGSTDGSGEILDAYAAKDKRFRVFHQANAGVSAARNVALEHAQGEWIWFVDGDDLIDEKALETFVKILQQHGSPDALFFDFEQGIEKTTSNEDAFDVHISQAISFATYQAFLRGGAFTLFKRRLIGDLQFKPYRMAEDSLFALAYCFKCKTFIDTTFKAYFYRIRENSAIQSTPSVQYVRDWLYALREMLKCLIEHQTSFHPQDLKRVVKEMANRCYYTRNRFFFKLPIKEARTVFGLWLSNFKMLRQLGTPPYYQRCIVVILTLFRSILLARLLVCFLPKVGMWLFYPIHVITRRKSV